MRFARSIPFFEELTKTAIGDDEGVEGDGQIISRFVPPRYNLPIGHSTHSLTHSLTPRNPIVQNLQWCHAIMTSHCQQLCGDEENCLRHEAALLIGTKLFVSSYDKVCWGQKEKDENKRPPLYRGILR